MPMDMKKGAMPPPAMEGGEDPAMAENQEAKNPEDDAVDQLGQLFAQLSPEKQQEVIGALQELMGPQEQASAGTVSDMGGPKGVPVSMGAM